MDREGIETYLARIAKGGSTRLLALLPKLAEQVMYTPVTNVASDRDSKGTQRIKVASYLAEGKKYVPAFTSEEYFLEWSEGKHQCFSVLGADLALTLPQETWLIIDPGRAHSIDLSPEQISLLAELEPLGEGMTEVSDDKTSLEEVAPDSAREQSFSQVDVQQLCEELKNVFQAFPSIEEAYIDNISTEGPRAVLGLLIKKITPDQRFILVDRIAEVSRSYFGAAGAIEVYDDLSFKNSNSWELFSTLTPFFENKATGTMDVGSDLTSISAENTRTDSKRKVGGVIGFFRR